MRQRKRDRHLPPCVYQHHGAYYLVRKGKWEPLGRDLPSSLAEYARRIQPARVGGMQRVIADALEARRAKLSKNTWAQYQVVARKLAGIFAEFEPHDVLPRHIAEGDEMRRRWVLDGHTGHVRPVSGVRVDEP